MLDGTIYKLIQKLRNEMLIGLYQLNLKLSGESIRAKAIEQILIDKKIMTEDTLKKGMAEVIKELNSKSTKDAEKAEAEKESKGLVKPTVVETKKVEDSKVIDPKK